MCAAYRYLASRTGRPARVLSVKVVLPIVVVALGMWASGCSTNSPAFEGIANRGITPVSHQSPFVGSNVFLGQEMEKSLYLYNFMKSRGAPQAIQVLGDSEMNSELLMFYSREREYFSAVPGIDPHTKSKEWILRGPFPITREHYPYIVHVNSDNVGVFEVFGKREVFGGSSKAAESRVIKPAFIPTPAPTPHPAKRPSKKQTNTPAQSQGPVITVQGTPMNLDQEALREARRVPTISNATTPSPQPNSPSPHSSLDDALKSTINTPPQPPSAGLKSGN